MKHPRLLFGLTVVNLLLLLVTLAQQVHVAFARGGLPVLRGSALEIIDDHGRIRASLNVFPASTSQQGDAYPETVLLRLNTEWGRPSVKISASGESSGLSFTGPTNTKDTHIILQTKGTMSSLQLRNEDGREQTITP